MPKKGKAAYRIDLPAPHMQAAEKQASTPVTTQPAPRVTGAPTNLQLTTAISASTAAPTAKIDATWVAPFATIPSSYTVQWSTSSTFPDGNRGQMSSLTTAATIDGLRVGVLYYVRVAAFVAGVQSNWSATQSITTATDLVAAGVPTSIAAVFFGTGDLLVTWVPPTDANLKDVQVIIRGSSGGTIYRTDYSASGSYRYTVQQNFFDVPGGAGDPSLYVELRSRTVSGVLGTVVNTGLVTKAVPAVPASVTHSWSGDTLNNGVADATWTLNWARAEDAARYRISIDTVLRQITADQYTYAFALNVSEHAGTPDPALAYSLVAVDGFGQVSTAASGTATNHNPPAPTVALLQGAVSSIHAVVTGTIAKDFKAYRYVWKRDGTTVRTQDSAASTMTYELSGANDGGFHSWTVEVRQIDLFDQLSTNVVSSAVAFEALTLSTLRAGIRYTDSLGTAPATLKAAFADGNTTSGGVSYGA